MIYSKENTTLEDYGNLVEIELYNSKKYFSVLREVVSRINDFSNINEKIICLEYTIELIKESVIAEYAALSTYPYYCNATNEYIARLNSCIMTFSQYESYEGIVNTKGKDILSTSVKHKSMVEFIKNKKIGSIQKAIYVPQLNLISAYEDGYHRMAAIKYLKGSVDIPVRIIDFNKQYDLISTNGVYWFNKSSANKELTSDYRFPLIYTLYKIKNVLCGNSLSEILGFDGIILKRDGTLDYDPSVIINFSKEHNISISNSNIFTKRVFKLSKSILIKICNK